MLIRLFHVLLAAMAATPALAGTSAWVEIAPEARLRLISSDTVVDGKTLAALEIDMPPNMKTYWRIPGETGIPVEIDMSASSGIAGHQTIWPYPLREQKDGYIDFVYYGHTVLPLELELSGQDAAIAASVLMGVCTDICVPVRADLSLALDFATADQANALRIRQAVALAPIDHTADPAPVGEVTFSGAQNRVEIEYVPGQVDPRSIIVDTGDPAVLFSLPRIDEDRNIVAFEPVGRRNAADLAGQTAEVTFMTAEGAYRVWRTIGTP